MMAEIWRGAPVAAALTAELTERARRLRQSGTEPCLAIVRVGERSDDVSYETGAVKRCEKIGVAVRRFLLPEDCSRQEVLETIRRINRDPSIHGCLLFRPLPDRETEQAACRELLPEKDVDGMTQGALAGVFAGGGRGYAPCTAQACMELLRYYGYDPAGKRAVVIGRSLVIGRPAAMLLLAANATVTVCHTATADLPAVCREAELVVAAAGRARMVDRNCISPGQVIVDVGIHVDAAGNLCGDVDFQAAEPVAAAITPVPGGVGAVTTAVLAKHVIEAAEKARP